MHDPDQEIFEYCAFLARTSATAVSSAWFRQQFCAEAIAGLADEYGVPAKGLEYPALSLNLFLVRASAQQPKYVRADIDKAIAQFAALRPLVRGFRDEHVLQFQMRCEAIETMPDGSVNLAMHDPVTQMEERIDQCIQVLAPAEVPAGRGGQKYHPARRALEDFLWDLRRHGAHLPLQKLASLCEDMFDPVIERHGLKPPLWGEMIVGVSVVRCFATA